MTVNDWADRHRHGGSWFVLETDYEAAVEALAGLVDYVDARLPGSGPLARDEAHRVIARLRDKVPS